MIRVKRAYDPAEPGDGDRYLVDRIWPRGKKKEDLKLESWVKDVAPSDELRHWFGHEAQKWDKFQQRYFAELDNSPESWQPLLQAARKRKITLVFAAKDEEHNNAVALREYLEAKLKQG